MWTFDKDGDLVNLVHCQSIFVSEAEDSTIADPRYMVVAQRDSSRSDGTTVLFEHQDEAVCKSFIDSLAAHMQAHPDDRHARVVTDMRNFRV